ncbi:MAG: hypothetical protein KGL78_08830 [Burkholderiales bacterium]|nr:hypothetical protein [Burkholderiales bacterium]
MRFLFSIAALLLVLYLVLQLGSKQLQALKSDGGGAASAALAATPRNAAEAAAKRVTDALQQGAAARASDAQP